MKSKKSRIISVFMAIIGLFFITMSGAGPILADGQIVVSAETGCTLHDAIIAANNDQASGGCSAGNGIDTIILEPTDVVLSNIHNFTLGPNGLPAITSEIIIAGNGATIRRNEEAPAFRLFFITSEGNLTLDNVTVRGGLAQGGDGGFFAQSGGGGGAGMGGAIFNNSGGIVTVNQSSLLNNQARGGHGGHGGHNGGLGGQGGGGYGGAIFNLDGQVIITAGTLEGNQTRSGQGGTSVTDTPIVRQGSQGGAIHNHQEAGTATLLVENNSLFKANTTQPGAGGGISLEAGNLEITESTIEGNQASSGGGGIFLKGGNLEIKESTIEDNQAGANGGGVYLFRNSATILSDSRILNNVAGRFGGGIRGDDGILTIEKSVFDGNTSGRNGGAIHFAGEVLRLNHSYILSNQAQIEGGGLFLDEVTAVVQATTFYDNSSADGGAISQEENDEDSSLGIFNSTISQNRAIANEDGSDAEGGAIWVDGSVVISQTTIFDNTASKPEASGVYVEEGSLQIGSSILAGNTPNAQYLVKNSDDEIVVSTGHNRETVPSGFLTQSSDATLGDPGLLPLADNGGAAPTHLPGPDSPLIDQIPAEQCEVNEDQRGLTRPQGVGCDIGAVEQGDLTPDPTPTPSPVPDGNFTVYLPLLVK